jgi:hypothetical protein
VAHTNRQSVPCWLLANILPARGCDRSCGITIPRHPVTGAHVCAAMATLRRVDSPPNDLTQRAADLLGDGPLEPLCRHCGRFISRWHRARHEARLSCAQSRPDHDDRSSVRVEQHSRYRSRIMATLQNLVLVQSGAFRHLRKMPPRGGSASAETR